MLSGGMCAGPDFNLRDLCKAAGLIEALMADQMQHYQLQDHQHSSHDAMQVDGYDLPLQHMGLSHEEVRIKAVASVLNLVYAGAYKSMADKLAVKRIVDEGLAMPAARYGMGLVESSVVWWGYMTIAE